MAQSGSVPKQLIRNDYSSTNVTTSAYVELSSALSGNSNEIEIFDSSGQVLVLASGPSGSESDIMYVMPGGNGRIQLVLSAGERLSIKAIDGNAASGQLVMNLWG